MSSPPIFINQTETAPIKRGRGRPRKIDSVTNATPSDAQKYRIFKSITEPNILDNIEIQSTDLKTQLEELYLNSLDPIQKIQKSYDDNKVLVQTNNYEDYNALQLRQKITEREKKIADRKQQRKLNKAKNIIPVSNPKNPNKPPVSNTNKSAMSAKSTLPKKERENKTQTGEMPMFNYNNRTIDNQKTRQDKKGISYKITSPSKKSVSQGTDAQALTKNKEINQAGNTISRIKIAQPREINKIT